jgi:hypothetical protein
MNDCHYTRAEFDALTDEQRRALELVAGHRGLELEADDQADAEVQDEAIQEAFGLFRPCKGCVPGDEIGDNLCLTVREKFATIYDPAIEMAEALLRREGHWADSPVLGMRVLADASYEDQTNVTVVDWRPDKRPFCYLADDHKAWNYSFTTLAGLADEVLGIRDRLVEQVRGLLSSTRLTREDETYEAAVSGLTEYYPCLKNAALVAVIRGKVIVPDTGNQQADYEETRDQVERYAEEHTNDEDEPETEDHSPCPK